MNDDRIQLDTEDLARWRMNAAKLAAIGVAAAHYSVSEIEAVFHDQYRLVDEFTEKYEVDRMRTWMVNAHSGFIYYMPQPTAPN